MKVYIKAVGNTVFFKQFDSAPTKFWEHIFIFEDMTVKVGSYDVCIGSNLVCLHKRGTGFSSCDFIDFMTSQEAQDYAEKLKRICAEVVKRYRDKEEVKDSEDGIYVF